MKKIYAIRECNLDQTMVKTMLVLFSINPKTRTIRTIFRSEDKLTEVDLISSEIHCHEMITKKGKDLIRRYYQEHQGFL